MRDAASHSALPSLLSATNLEKSFRIGRQADRTVKLVEGKVA